MKRVSKDVVSEKKSEVDDDIRYSEDIIRPLKGHLVLRHLIEVTFFDQIRGGLLVVLKPQADHSSQTDHHKCMFLHHRLGFDAESARTNHC